MLAWRSEGPDDGPALVLLHGLGESMRCWARVVPLLADQFRTILIDLPGFGRSPAPQGEATIVADARSVREALKNAGVSHVTVVGHSLGGAVAVALGEQSRGQDTVARLVLVNTPPTFDSRLTARKGSERILRMPVVGPLAWRAATESKLRDGLRSAFAPGYEVPDEFVSDLQATSWGAFAGATSALDDYLAERRLADRIKSLGTPATIVFGEQDQRVDPESLTTYDDVPNATVIRIATAGHTPLWEEPELTAAAIANR